MHVDDEALNFEVGRLLAVVEYDEEKIEAGMMGAAIARFRLMVRHEVDGVLEEVTLGRRRVAHNAQIDVGAQRDALHGTTVHLVEQNAALHHTDIHNSKP